MSLEALNESNLRAVQRHLESNVERLRGELEQAALKGDTTKCTRISGGIEQARHLIQQCERQIRVLNGDDK